MKKIWYRNKNAHWAETDVRRRALALLKTCWLPVLLAALLVMGVHLVMIAAQMGLEQAITDHYEALRPEGPTPSELLMMGQSAPEGFDPRAWDEYHQGLMTRDRLLPLAELATDIPNVLLNAVLMLGISRGLLASLRGGKCTVGSVFSGFRRGGWKALWLTVLVWLRQMGYMIPVILVYMVLIRMLPLELTMLVGIIAMVGFAIWLMYRYALASLSLADERYAELSATDHIRRGLEDAASYGVMGILLTIWPVLAMQLTAAVLAIFTGGWWAEALMLLLILAATVIEMVCLPTIYMHLNADAAPQESEDEGLARARALMTE